ncbi:ETEC_3214 domain-containing protein [Peribacillus frigoritolerans]|uniref:ETEC_3214 domain-containing protein n=1 Tax=Peribacillus castrilensis TaxID=2897690 RepID=UPI003DA2A8F8
MHLERRIDNFKKKKGVRILIYIAASITLIGGLVQNGKEIKNFVMVTFLQKTFLYETIDKLTTDVQVSYFDKLLGKPAIIQPWWSEEFPRYKQYIYINDDYFVKTIADDSNTVLYYAITTRKQDFNPNLPSVFGKDLKLGKDKINDINAEPEYFSLDASSKFEYYQESYYFGNIGNYGSYLIGGYSPSEYSQDFSESDYSIYEIVMEKDEEIKDSKTQDVRKTLVPNTYGVISGSARPEFKEQIIQNLEISIDFFDAIKFRK